MFLLAGSAVAVFAESGRAPATLALSIVDRATGAPIDGAAVTVRIEAKESAAQAPGGKARIEIPAGATYVRIAVTANGYVPMALVWDDVKGVTVPAEYTLRLYPAQRMGGVVKDGAGRTIEGAEAVINASPTGATERVNVKDFRVKTDADGRWEAQVISKETKGIVIGFSHPDYRLTATAALAEMFERPEEALTVMSAIYRVAGKVTDEEGRPLEAAVILGANQYSQGQMTARSGKDGKYSIEFDDAARGQMLMYANMNRPSSGAPSVPIVATAPGFATHAGQVAVSVGTAIYDIAFEKGRTLRGRVVDEEGNPIAGARLTLRTPAGEQMLQATAVTDRDGRFECEQVASGVIAGYFYREGYEPTEFRAAETGETVVTLPRERMVEITAVDAATGEAVREFKATTGYRYNSGPQSFFQGDQRLTARDGRCQVRGSQLAGNPPRVVRVEARGYEPAEMTAGDAIGGTLEFRLEKGRSVSGFVRDADGKPVKGADVVVATQQAYTYFSGKDLRVSGGGAAEKTDKEGRFWLGEAPEQSLVVAASDYGFATAPGGRARYKMDLEPWGRIEGTTRLRGRPAATQVSITVPTVKLDLYPGVFERAKEAYDALRKTARPGRMRFVDVVHFSTPAVTSKRDGEFVIERVRPGRVTLSRGVSTSAGNMAGAKSYTETVEVEVKPAGTVRLDFGGRGRAVSGRVTMTNVTPAVMCVDSPRLTLLPAPPDGDVPGLAKAAGPAAAAQMVQRWRETEEGKRFYTGRTIVTLTPAKDGAFRIEDLAAGKYWMLIELQAANIGALTIGKMLEVTDGEGEVDLGLLKVK
jgi:protocatechuate 3,4-dioxygenase beta subunit